jgi:hypothetical protein
MEARNSAIESLKYEEQYKNIALALFPMFRSNFYQESMEYMGDASVSYEESLYYRSKLKEEFPTDINKRRYQEIKELQSKYSRWFSAQRVIVGTFYSRVNPELDKGKYAAGISMLDVILTNAQNSSYKLDYEEYVDILDDICATAVQLLMQKVAVRHQLKIGEYEAKELGCIMEKPIRYLTDFYPDCLPKDKELFGNHFKSWKLIPWINEVSGWEKLSPFFT